MHFSHFKAVLVPGCHCPVEVVDSSAHECVGGYQWAEICQKLDLVLSL
jgi:hypothetical protein